MDEDKIGKKNESEEKDGKDQKDHSEYEAWCRLYDYVQMSLFGYPKETKLTKYTIGRLHGIRQGKFMGNKKKKTYANYPYEVILNTLMVNSQSIRDAFKRKGMKSEYNKTNYMAAVIENNINDMYLRMINLEQEKQKSEQIDHSISTDSDLDGIYKKKNESMKSQKRTERKNKFADLW